MKDYIFENLEKRHLLSGALEEVDEYLVPELNDSLAFNEDQVIPKVHVSDNEELNSTQEIIDMVVDIQESSGVVLSIYPIYGQD